MHHLSSSTETFDTSWTESWNLDEAATNNDCTSLLATFVETLPLTSTMKWHPMNEPSGKKSWQYIKLSIKSSTGTDVLLTGLDLGRSDTGTRISNQVGCGTLYWYSKWGCNDNIATGAQVLYQFQDERKFLAIALKKFQKLWNRIHLKTSYISYRYTCSL